MIYELSIIHKSQIINQNSFLFQFTIIDHMFGFTHTPLDAARLDNPYIGLQTDYTLHTVRDFLLQGNHLVHFVRIKLLTHFYLNLECVRIVYTVDHNQNAVRIPAFQE